MTETNAPPCRILRHLLIPIIKPTYKSAAVTLAEAKYLADHGVDRCYTHRQAVEWVRTVRPQWFYPNPQ